MRNKLMAEQTIAIDVDPAIIEAWRALSVNGIEFLQGDAAVILPTLNLASSDLVYADPPYVPSTRRTPKYYRHDYDDADHRHLLAVLRRLDCMVVLSGYRSEIYDREIGDWHRRDYETVTHRGVVTESVWTNFIPGAVLHDYSHVGSTFRQREAIRRRLNSIVRQLQTADPIERNAALAMVAASYPEAILEASRRVMSS